jgi:hypothetical protein
MSGEFPGDVFHHAIASLALRTAPGAAIANATITSILCETGEGLGYQRLGFVHDAGASAAAASRS